MINFVKKIESEVQNKKLLRGNLYKTQKTIRAKSTSNRPEKLEISRMFEKYIVKMRGKNRPICDQKSSPKSVIITEDQDINLLENVF